jgi:hypothetical protein
MPPDPKPAKRKKFTREEWADAKLVFHGSVCRVSGCEQRYDDLHHLLARDGFGTWPSGDDDLRNLIPLCEECHHKVTDGDVYTRSQITIVPANYEYLAERIGSDRWLEFLSRIYHKGDYAEEAA